MEGIRWRLRLAVLVAVPVVALCGCGSDAGDLPANAEPSPKVTVAMVDGAYVPPKVRIAVGTRVTFVNRVPQANTAETDGVGFFEFDRNLLDRENLFDIHTVQQGEAESVEFDTPGFYRYKSSVDSTMTGVIEVVQAQQ
jgi:plastocyanin